MQWNASGADIFSDETGHGKSLTPMVKTLRFELKTPFILFVLLVSLSSKGVVNGCNTEEVIEPTIECIISRVAFSVKKRGGVKSKEVKVP